MPAFGVSKGEFAAMSAAILGGASIGMLALGTELALIKTVFDSVSRAVPQGIETIKSCFKYDSKKINFSPSEIKLKLVNNMSPIIGHEEEKQTIINMILGWLETKRNPNLSKKTGGLVLYLVGGSGTGKTMMATSIAKALLGNDSKYMDISLSSIDSASSLSTAEQLFGVKEESANGNLKIKKATPLLNQLRRNPKTVIIINEYDKLQARDGSLDGCLWDISDSGVIDLNGEKIDCSQAIIIATSNEAPSCVGKPGAFVDDGSTTNVVHSKAFLNRIKPVVFSGLNEKEYERIINNQLKQVIADYKQKYNLIINISKSMVSMIAKDILEANRGAREVNTYINNLYAELVSYRIDKGIEDCGGKSKHKTKPVKLDISYTSSDHKFHIN